MSLSSFRIPPSLKNVSIYMVGIKGTGMCALAELFHERGAKVSGVDTSEIFYTDAILKDRGIPYHEGFQPAHVNESIALVVYSAAYSPKENSELIEAGIMGIPMLTYTQALGELSNSCDASGVSGIHGKTTTTALAGLIAEYLEIPSSIVVGSAVKNFANHSSLVMGDQFLIAETCEYRRHFLDFHPDRIIITNIELDHNDYYRDVEDVADAFSAYIKRLPQGGACIYCHDDPETRTLIENLSRERSDLRYIQYGISARGEYRILDIDSGDRTIGYRLQGFPEQFELHLPPRHNVLNATAATALVIDILRGQGREPGVGEISKIKEAIGAFRGTKRRSELIGEAGGVIFVDDYAHHPTALRSTLAGLKDFFRGRRIIVDFMSHTYTRTERFVDDFAESFSQADILILHKIYASAREKKGEIDGPELFRRLAQVHPRAHYYDAPLDALEFCLGELRERDLFVTMGAGDNWKLGYEVFNRMNGDSAF